MQRLYINQPLRLIIVGLSLVLFLVSAPLALAEEPVIVVVKLNPGVDPAVVSADHQALLLGDIVPLALARLQKADPNFLNDLQADPRVAAAWSDPHVEGQPRYADPDLNQELEAQRRTVGAGGDPGADYFEQWAVDKVRIPQAKTVTTGVGITVAVLDTGVDLDHPLLAGKLVAGYDFVDDDANPDDTANGLDDDGDSIIDEGAGHGTHVAGIVTLVAPDAAIMPVRIFNSDGFGTYFDAAAGIVYAVDNGAKIINLSGSGPEDVDFFQEAVQYAWDNGTIMVTSGGLNELGYPAKYEHVVSVGASDPNDYRTDFSSFQDGDVTVYAPGRSIFSAYGSGGYAWWTGNSMAAPFVAGEAALLFSSGNCDKNCVTTLIVTHGRPVPEVSSPRIDLYDAVSAAAGQLDINLKVQYMDGDGVPANLQIKPFVKIVNNGNSLPLSNLKLHYWYTNDGSQVSTISTDYADLGVANIISQVVSIVPLPGADRYLEAGFTAQAGIVYGGGNSGLIELRLDGSQYNYDETDDYSFDATKTALTDWQQVTLYYNDALVWGVEPGLAIPSGGLKVQYRAVGSPTDNQIEPYLNILNTGPSSVPLDQLTARYWYTRGDNQPQQYHCNYAVLNCTKIVGHFVELNAPRDGADAYLEISFEADAGEIPPNGQSGEIQNRFNKINWAPYNENDDFSADMSKTILTDWERVTLYRNGDLVWGLEPNTLPLTPTSTPTPTPLPPTPTPTPAVPTPTPTNTPPVPTPTPTNTPPVPTPTPTNTPPAPSPTPTNTPPAGSESCSINYVNQNDWGSGATINVTITNNNSSTINGWTLEWTFPGNQQITSLWNGSYSQSGSSVSVSNAPWNGTISANGGTAGFGFNLAYSGSNNAPTDFALNGTACQ